jgi:hypothetical protein
MTQKNSELNGLEFFFMAAVGFFDDHLFPRVAWLGDGSGPNGQHNAVLRIRLVLVVPGAVAILLALLWAIRR